MTKAEAIAMLTRIQEPEAYEPQINQAAFKALDMAIEALGQKPSEDIISRQAAIDALEEPCKVPDSWTDEYAVGERAQYEKDVKALNSLPSAERREVQSSECEYWDDESNFCTLNRPSAERLGQWVSQEYMSEIDSFIYTEYKCSNCGEISKKKSNYCPNCGAKMDGEEK